MKLDDEGALPIVTFAGRGVTDGAEVGGCGVGAVVVLDGMDVGLAYVVGMGGGATVADLKYVDVTVKSVVSETVSVRVTVRRWVLVFDSDDPAVSDAEVSPDIVAVSVAELLTVTVGRFISVEVRDRGELMVCERLGFVEYVGSSSFVSVLTFVDEGSVIDGDIVPLGDRDGDSEGEGVGVKPDRLGVGLLDGVCVPDKLPVAVFDASIVAVDDFVKSNQF